MAYTFDISDNRRIVEALKTGDEETFKEVYTAFCAPLRHYATTILQNEQAAYEVVQDVFTAVWLNRKRLDAAKPLRNYLLRASTTRPAAAAKSAPPPNCTADGTRRKRFPPPNWPLLFHGFLNRAAKCC